MFFTDCFVCICITLMSNCLVNGISISGTSVSDTSTITSLPSSYPTVSYGTGTFATGTFSTISSTLYYSAAPFIGSDMSDLPTGNTPSTSASLSSSAENSTESDNNNSTSPQSTTTTTTATTTTTTTTTMKTTTTSMLTFCKNGTCSGIDSSCLNETIADTCLLSGSQSCQQIVFTNTTDTYYEVGCSDSCGFLVEETGVVTKTTRCCDTNMCNNELLSDPDQGNSGVQIHISCFLIMLLLYLSRMFN